jgi:hypothetical protein
MAESQGAVLPWPQCARALILLEFGHDLLAAALMGCHGRDLLAAVLRDRHDHDLLAAVLMGRHGHDLLAAVLMGRHGHDLLAAVLMEHHGHDLLAAVLRGHGHDLLAAAPIDRRYGRDRPVGLISAQDLAAKVMHHAPGLQAELKPRVRELTRQ